ncbi:FAD-dependent monooxygenase [Streptomyces sp. NPDC058467]|uniref:FAD-dependent monooxygenase n=1 Tax=Streptomyces sp. NPDC058467 TaxID=3346513 RepID=UPI00365D0E4D
MPTSPATPVLPTHTDVLIVGSGPAGLTLAASLRRLGVDHVLIDRNPGTRSGSRAAAVQPGALEYLDRIGVTPELIRAGKRGRGFRLHDRERTLLRVPYDGLDTPYPFVLLASQQTTEEQLLCRLEELGGRVYRSHTYLGHAAQFPGVAATVAGPDGVLRAISARYLVGCDGVHSAVRTTAGIGFPGEAPEELFALADVRLVSGDENPSGTGPGNASTTGYDDALRDDTTFFLSPFGMLLLSPLADDRHRIVSPAAPDGTAPGVAAVQRMLSERGPLKGTLRVAEVVSAATYRVQERVAERFRAGPVLLAGDAAHTHSPAGGQGMNTGIQDAGNLAWKLHAVLDMAAPEALLDSYHLERHPVAAALVAFTGQFARLANLRDTAAGQRRNGLLAAAAAAPGVTDWIATRLAQLDVDYTQESAPRDPQEPPDGSPRVGERISPLTVPASGLRWTLALPVHGTSSDGRPADRYGSGTPADKDPADRHGPLAVRYVPGLPATLLVRPDGYLAARGVPADPDDVLERLREYLPSAASR